MDWSEGMRPLQLTGASRRLTGFNIRGTAARAKTVGLVHAVVVADQMDRTVEDYVQEILSAAPEAVAAAKALLQEVAGRPAQDTIEMTADTLAARRVSAEGQEGLRAFLEKRKAIWNVSR